MHLAGFSKINDHSYSLFLHARSVIKLLNNFSPMGQAKCNNIECYVKPYVEKKTYLRESLLNLNLCTVSRALTQAILLTVGLPNFRGILNLDRMLEDA